MSCHAATRGARVKLYGKIVTAWTRDPENRYKTLIEGEWATQEFGYLSDALWRATEKIDGTNTRVIWDGETVTFGGKTERANIPAFLVNKLLELFPAEKFGAFDSPVVLFGEGFGARIQKDGEGYIPDGVDFSLFDVAMETQEGWLWQDHDRVVELAKSFGIRHVPVIGVGSLLWVIEQTREGFESRIGDRQAEGMVARPLVELRDRRGNRIITKVKTKDFQ